MSGTQAATPPVPPGPLPPAASNSQPAPLGPGSPQLGPAPPRPRRLTRPRWINVRVVGGVLLLIAAVVVGARVVGASAQTTPVWAADRDLAAGTVLGAGDLISVEVNLGDAAGMYLSPADATPEGRTVVNPLRAGELLPVAALEDTASGRVVAVSVDPPNIPPGVTHGSRIDLYLTTKTAGAEQEAQTELIGRNLTVQSVTPPASGGLSGATSNRYQITVLLEADEADSLVRSLPIGDPIIVLVSGAGG